MHLRGGYTSNFRFRVLLYLIDRHALISYPNCPKSVLNETSVYCEVFCKIYIFQNCNTFGESPGDKKNFRNFFEKSWVFSKFISPPNLNISSKFQKHALKWLERQLSYPTEFWFLALKIFGTRPNAIMQHDCIWTRAKNF